MLRRRTKFADLSVSVFVCRSSAEYDKAPDDPISEAACIRQDFACGVEADKVRKCFFFFFLERLMCC